MLLDGIDLQTSRTHGSGLIAKNLIPRGTVVWHPCPQCPLYPASSLAKLSESEFSRLDIHGYYLVNGDIILPCRNACMMNHSCDANVLDFGLDFGVAVRNIEPGTEITLDYATFQSDRPWKFECACGAPVCRGLITCPPVNLQNTQDRWRSRLSGALESIRNVPQSLGASLMSCSAVYHKLLYEYSTLCFEAHITIRNPAFLNLNASTQ